ncbi:MAG: LysR substrate-binding domain-containing protein [Chloroflexota bacterium]
MDIDMDFRTYDALRLFVVVAHHASFTSAGEALNLTKGAVSYQIKQLERELGFQLFTRLHGGIMLTQKGERLWHSAQLVFQDLEQEITTLRDANPVSITIGMSTYFALRWLSPRLMNFITTYPQIRLRIQPVIGLGDLRADQLDLMIRWGKGGWSDVKTELLFQCPAIPTAGATLSQYISDVGLLTALPTLTLLHDHEESDAWRDWYEAASFPYRPKQDSLVIPDPNVRVQAVIHGQGVALNDSLVSNELTTGQLVQISPIELPAYGYHLSYMGGALSNPALRAFHDWIVTEVSSD